jgi:hypothetical protein
VVVKWWAIFVVKLGSRGGPLLGVTRFCLEVFMTKSNSSYIRLVIRRQDMPNAVLRSGARYNLLGTRKLGASRLPEVYLNTIHPTSCLLPHSIPVL